MNIIKKYKILLLITLPILVLVMARSMGTNHFRNDARKLAEPSFTRENIITPGKASQLEGRKLQINLEKDVIKHIVAGAESLTITPDSILGKTIIRRLLRNEGPVFLSSSEIAVSVRIWMILSQMGVSDLYILSDDEEPEVLKYEFRTDTTASPELL